MSNALNLGDALGVAEDASIERLTLYIPSRDRDGRRFDPRPWVDEALRLLSQIGGGGNRNAAGRWRVAESGNGPAGA